MRTKKGKAGAKKEAEFAAAAALKAAEKSAPKKSESQPTGKETK